MPPSIAKKKIHKFGSEKEFRKHYVSTSAAKLLRQGHTVDEIREALGGKELPKIKPIILTRLNLMRKKKGLRAAESEEKLQRQRYLNSKEYRQKMLDIKEARANMTDQQYIEEATGGKDGCQRELGGTCHRPDIFLSWNNRACDGCPYYKYCLCYNRRLSHEKKKPKKR